MIMHGMKNIKNKEMECEIMLDSKASYYKILADKIIDKLVLRNMEGYYAVTKEEALQLIKEKFLTEGVSVAWGGSMTMTEMGLMEYLQSGESGCVVYDRMTANTPEEQKAMKANIVNADYFIMSTNAITMDGELVNIDGTANRVSFLCYGPDNVLIIAGMNKVATDVEDALKRVKNIASPPNAIRLHRETPCTQNGRCTDCLAEDCICSQTVITRRSSVKGRIKVILVGEELGF